MERLEMEDKYEPVALRERYLAYLADFIMVLSVSSIIAAALGAGPVVQKICAYYLYGEHKILKEISSHSGMVFIATYLSVAFFYFFYESYSGISVGKVIFKMNAAIVKGENEILRCVLRAIIKIIPLVVFIDALFAFKKRLKQTLSERKLGFVVVREKEIKISKMNYFLFALIVYYTPLITAIIIDYFFPWGQIIGPSPPGSMKNLKPSEGQLNLIFMNNFSIDYQYYILGGLVLLLNSILQLFGGSLLSGKAIGDSLLTHPSFVIYGVFPHFFIETLGYVFGIMSGAYISTMLISLAEGYFERRDVSYVGNTILWHLKRIIIFAMISIALVAIAAYVETYVTSYILSHFY